MRNNFQNLAILLVILTLFLIGCGGKDETAKVTENSETTKQETFGKLSVKCEHLNETFDLTYAKFGSFKKGLILKDSDIQNKDQRIQALVYRIYLGNYDLNLTDPSKQDYERIKSKDQLRVDIQIEAEKDAEENALLKPGSYENKEEPFNRVSIVTLSHLDEGSDFGHLLAGKETKGSVKITSVNDTEIKGEIDYSDSDGSVKGEFTAKKLDEN